MANKTYRVTLAVGADKSLVDVAKPMVRAVEEAKVKAEAGIKAVVGAAQKGGKDISDHLGKGFDDAAKKATEAAKASAQAELEAAKIIVDAAGRRRHAKGKFLKDEAAEEQRKWDAAVKYAEKAQREIDAHETAQHNKRLARERKEREETVRNRQQTAKAIISDSLSNVKETFGMARGVAGQFLGGLGVGFDISGGVRRAVDLESQAVSISNADYVPGQKRQSPAELENMARAIGDKYAFDPSKVMAGLAAFQAKTGQMDVGKAGLDDLSKLAKATSTSLDDMISAAGDVGNALGDAFGSPEAKAKAVYNVMKAIAAQGQAGAVEIKDLAVQMAKLSAASQFFAGDRQAALQNMGALAQLSRAYGGAASATQAATSIMAFVNTMRTPARLAMFDKYKVDVYSKKKGEEGQIVDPFEVIKRSIVATNADPKQMKEMWANVLGDKPVMALANAFLKAGGANDKDKGLKAVDELIAKFNVTMSDQAIGSNVSAAMDTRESKAQIFQNKLDRIVASMADRVLPAMEKLAPDALAVAEAFGKLVSWASENPGMAITTAITGSIAKAAIGNAVATSLSKIIETGAKGSVMSILDAARAGGGMAGGKATSFLAGAALTFAVAAASFQITKAIIEWTSEEASKGENRSLDQDFEVMNALTAYKAAMQSGDAGEKTKALAELERVQTMQQNRVQNAQDPTSYIGAMFSFDKTIQDASAEKHDAERLPDLKADLQAVVAAIKDLKSGIPVTNMPAQGLSMSSDGRTSATGG